MPETAMTDPNADIPLEGTTWHLVRGVPVPEGTTISARFAGGTLTGSVGAHRYRASYVLDGDRLRIGPPTATAVIGDEAHRRSERDFLFLLGAVAGYRREPPDGLVLLDEHGDAILEFRAAPAIARPLGGRWRVAAVRVGDEERPPIDGTDPHLVFDASGQVAGSGGVNRFSGPARSDGDRLHIGPLRVTRKAGPPEAMDLETAFLTELENAAGYRFQDHSLVLLDADGEPAVRLVRGQG